MFPARSGRHRAVAVLQQRWPSAAAKEGKRSAEVAEWPVERNAPTWAPRPPCQGLNACLSGQFVSSDRCVLRVRKPRNTPAKPQLLRLGGEAMAGDAARGNGQSQRGDRLDRSNSAVAVRCFHSPVQRPASATAVASSGAASTSIVWHARPIHAPRGSVSSGSESPEQQLQTVIR